MQFLDYYIEKYVLLLRFSTSSQIARSCDGLGGLVASGSFKAGSNSKVGRCGGSRNQLRRFEKGEAVLRFGAPQTHFCFKADQSQRNFS
jgi:hypothetical protein